MLGQGTRNETPVGRGLGMRQCAHHIGDEVEGDYEEQDEENWGCRTPEVGFHHHIWVAGEEEGREIPQLTTTPAVHG